MNISVAQLGSRMHYAVPRILFQEGILNQLFTDICASKGWPRLLGAIPPSLRTYGIKQLLSRIPRDIPPEYITAFNGLGLEYARRLNAATNRTNATAAHLWATDRFSELIIHHGLGEADAIYGFNAGCSKLYQGAKQNGYKVVMEQFIAPRLVEKRLLDPEQSKACEWGQIEEDGLVGEVVQREQIAWHLADIILCGSEFVRQGVVTEGGPAEKCVVIPYGVELSDFDVGDRAPRGVNDPLRVLFVGSVSTRKGARYLLNAMRQLEDMPVHCRMIGGWQVSSDVLRRHTPPNVELVGQIPRSYVAREYACADVFCLPSLCEGSAVVVYEALAAGLPVITTHNSGSIVRDGLEGFIVPIQDSRAIAEGLERLASEPSLLRMMSVAARERSTVGSIEAYRQRLLEVLKSVA